MSGGTYLTLKTAVPMNVLSVNVFIQNHFYYFILLLFYLFLFLLFTHFNDFFDEKLNDETSLPRVDWARTFLLISLTIS